jgi:hypothetical protein
MPPSADGMHSSAARRPPGYGTDAGIHESTGMPQGDDRIDRFLEQALRFEEAAKSASDPDCGRYTNSSPVIALLRKLAKQVQALRERSAELGDDK